MNYCVYTHSYDNEVVYIGCGRSVRPWKKETRNKLWWRFYKSKGMPKVHVLFEFSSYKEALKKEKEMIDAQLPIINLYGKQKQARGFNSSLRPVTRIDRLRKLRAQIIHEKFLPIPVKGETV